MHHFGDLMNRWEEALQKGGTSPDVLHSELRVACMREDIELIKKLINIDGIPVDSFNSLALTISEYHNKRKSVETLKGIRGKSEDD